MRSYPVLLQKIVYGVDTPHARQEYVDTYGCARWTAGALRCIGAFGPIVEIGAGAGIYSTSVT